MPGNVVQQQHHTQMMMKFLFFSQNNNLAIWQSQPYGPASTHAGLTVAGQSANAQGMPAGMPGMHQSSRR